MPLGGAPVFVAGFGGPVPMARFQLPQRQPARYRISGVTRDASGDELGNCAVLVFERGSDMLRGETVSDGMGNYAVDVTSDETGLSFYAVAFKSGANDRAGVTVDTLVGTP